MYFDLFSCLLRRVSGYTAATYRRENINKYRKSLIIYNSEYCISVYSYYYKHHSLYYTLAAKTLY